MVGFFLGLHYPNPAELFDYLLSEFARYLLPSVARLRDDIGHHRRDRGQREFDMLSDLAKNVLLTCALFPGPVSLPEIEVTAEIAKDRCHSAIQELHKLFLLPRPSFTEEAPRFALNSNTRQLVREVYGGTDSAKRISSLIKVIIGEAEATPAHRRQVGQHIRQAISFVKLDRHSDAETTLLHAIDLYSENADLHGTLETRTETPILPKPSLS